MDKIRQKLIQNQLYLYRNKFERIKSGIENIDFICEGSLVKRWNTCGNSNCQCYKSKNKLHGPYYQLSWKEKAKTISLLISKEEANLYEKWIDNRRKLMFIINEMMTISLRGITCILKMKIRKNNKLKTKKLKVKKLK